MSTGSTNGLAVLRVGSVLDQSVARRGFTPASIAGLERWYSSNDSANYTTSTDNGRNVVDAWTSIKQLTW